MLEKFKNRDCKIITDYNSSVTKKTGQVIAGFTLAEVLITLAVIGVVAMIIIPNMINSTSDTELKTAWKKDFADLSNTYKLMIMDNGGSAKGLFQSTYDIKDNFKKYLNYSKDCANANVTECFHAAGTTKNLNGTTFSDPPNVGLVLSNGTLIGIPSSGSDYSGCTTAIGTSTAQSCSYIYIDVNGFKSPNIVGKDIFMVYLQDTSIVPAGTYFRSSESACIMPGQAGWTGGANEGWKCSQTYLYQ
jgi:prepilin-type N-terminal cleavage/methylation domain-containing protein